MANQEIPNTGGDVIKSVDPSQWKQASNCPKPFHDSVMQFNDGTLIQLNDGSVLGFRSTT